MTEINFAEELREKMEAASRQTDLDLWWQQFAPHLVKASEQGRDRYEVNDLLSPGQIDFCVNKGLQVLKTSRHFHPDQLAAPWYIISWGTK